MSAPSLDLSVIGNLLEKARKIAIAYYGVTGRPLGITGEIGEYHAAKLLGLELAPVRSPGFDAVDPQSGRRYQVKTRAFGSKARSQRLGSIKRGGTWDAVLLVILDEKFRPIAIYESNRKKVEGALRKPGSKARNERRALAVSQFKSIAKERWRAA